MNKKIIGSLAGAVALMLWVPSTLAVNFTDTFDGPSVDSGWVVDRYLPQTVDIQTIGGQSALHLGVNASGSAANRPSSYSSSFYNYQGVQHDLAGTPPEITLMGFGIEPWTASGQMYVTDQMLSQSSVNASIWLRSGNVGSETGAEYNIVAIRNPLGTTAGYFIWDANVGWVEVSTPATTGWHDFQLSYDGSLLRYSVDGTEVHTATPSYVAGPTTIFAEIYNAGIPYDAYFDNLSVVSGTSAVPDNGATAGMLLLGLGGMAYIKRKANLV